MAVQRHNGAREQHGHLQDCGVNLQSMPIEIHVVTEQEFNDWVEESKLKYAAKNNLIANKK